MDWAALQAPLYMGFSSQEYWSGLPWPPAGDLPDPGIKPSSMFLALQTDSLPLTLPGKPKVGGGGPYSNMTGVLIKWAKLNTSRNMYRGLRDDT